jgi:hypothetical protein
MIDELKRERRLVGLNNNPIDIGFGIKTYVPTVDYYLDLIRGGINFKYLRYNHGMLDPFRPVFMMDELSLLINNKDYNQIANRVVKYHHNHNGYLKGWSTMDDTYVKMLSHFLEFFIENINDDNSEFDFGISLCNGIWRAIDHIDNPEIIARGNVFNTITNNLDRNYFHGGLTRHYAVTGEIYQFFNLLNELDYDVIFVGAPYFKMAKYEYDIKNFYHILIPYRNAIQTFDKTIESLKKIIVNPKTIILNSTGHDLSFYLANSLKGWNISQFDIGRALDWNMNQSFVENKFKSEFNQLPNGIYLPWQKYNENPWLIEPKEKHLNVIKTLRGGK